ncbi:MAG: MMPL family transporter, partial [Verrucomicrobiota bacterium]
IYGSGGWVDTSPLLQTLPTTQEEADVRQKRALQNPLLERSVISEDGEATLLSLYLKPQAEDQHAYEGEAYAAIEEILTKYQNDFDQVFQVGAPALQVWMSEYILQDQRLLLPLAAIIMVTLIGIMMGSFQAAIIPVLNAFIAGAVTLGFMSLVGIPISMLNYVIPALILIIGATEDVHILSEYREAKEEGLAGLDAVRGIAQRIGLTLLLTGITTTLGFAVTGLNAITLMQEFGLSAAFGMAARFFVSLCFLPAYLRYFGKAIKASNRATDQDAWHQRLTAKCCQIIMAWTRHPLRVLAVFTLIAAPCIFLIPNIRVSNDLISFLREDSPIRQKLDTVAERLSGNKVIYITFEGEAGDYKQIKRLKQVDRLANWLRERGDLDKVIAHTDFLALVNQAMYGNEPGSLEVPDKDQLVAQYLIFFHRSTLQPYVSGDYSQANIVIRCNLNDSQAVNELVKAIKTELDRGTFGKHSYTVTGQSVIVAAAVEEIIRGQVLSLSS